MNRPISAARRRRPDQAAQHINTPMNLSASQEDPSAHPINGSSSKAGKAGAIRTSGNIGIIGIHQPEIVGRFRGITAHQITMAWWLYQAGHITRRQLRVYFAAHEMHERRKYARPSQGRDDNSRRDRQHGTKSGMSNRKSNNKSSSSSQSPHALYRVEEIAAMVCWGDRSNPPPASHPHTNSTSESGGGGKDGNQTNREAGRVGLSPRSLASLRADIRHLTKLGLVTIESHRITFAVSIEQIRLHGADDLTGFWDMFHQIPNSKRTVPVPRRTLRALAGVGGLVGNSKAISGVMLAMLIRSLFWHKASASYRVDGRTKASWIVEVFGLSRRSVTDARATLIEHGWIEDLEPPQWAMNRWGSHDRINPDWAPKPIQPSQPIIPQSPQPVSSSPLTSKLLSPTAHPPKTVHSPKHIHSPYTGSASPQAQINTGSASPCLNKNYSSSTKKNLNTRRLGAGPSSPSGVSIRNGVGEKSRAEHGLRELRTQDKAEIQGGMKSGSRRKKQPRKVRGEVSVPSIRDIKLGHMQETSDLLELYRQAIAIGLAKPSEAGRLDFLALAERAKAHGKRAGALFYWLLREKKTVFITQSEEDAAAQRVREIYNPVKARRERWGSGDRSVESRMRGSSPLGSEDGKGRGLEPLSSSDASGGSGVSSKACAYTKDEQFVIACIRVAKKHRISDPYKLAREEGWGIDRWDQVLESYDAKKHRQSLSVCIEKDYGQI